MKREAARELELTDRKSLLVLLNAFREVCNRSVRFREQWSWKSNMGAGRLPGMVEALASPKGDFVRDGELS